jgi:hypothetical protein
MTQGLEPSGINSSRTRSAGWSGPDGQLEQVNRCAANNGSGQGRGEVLHPTYVHRDFQREVQAEDVRGGRADDAQLQH